MTRTEKIRIRCDFSGCDKTFDDVQEWSKHYLVHLGPQQVTFGELALAGKERMLQAVRYDPDMVAKGMVIRELNPLIGMRKVDMIGALPEPGAYALIDATVGTTLEPKIKKMRHCAKYLRKSARIFGGSPKAIRLFILTDKGVVEIPEVEPAPAREPAPVEMPAEVPAAQ